MPRTVTSHGGTSGRVCSIVRRGFEKFGIDDWTIVQDPRPFDAENPCASVYFDNEQRTVTIEAGIDLHPDGS